MNIQEISLNEFYFMECFHEGGELVYEEKNT